MMKRLRSRFTMQFEESLFIDTVSGELVAKYKDCYGKRYMATYPYCPFYSMRVHLY